MITITTTIILFMLLDIARTELKIKKLKRELKEL